MKLLLEQSSIITATAMDGRVLSFDVSIYDRTRLNKVVNVFNEINEFFDSLSDDEKVDIFNLYESMYNELYGLNDINSLTKNLTEIVGKLYSIINFQRIEMWFNMNAKSKFIIPETVYDEYGPDDPPDRTYLKRDYIKLVILAISLRPMIPIWGEYITRVRDQVGNEYKEYAAMRLMSRANSVLDSEPMKKLSVYVFRSIVNDQRTVAAIFGGLGTAELPDYLLALVVVRRLSVGEVHASVEYGNVITNIYGFLTGALKDLPRKFGGDITEKHRDLDGEEEDAESIAESYKVKSDVSPGDVYQLSRYTQDVKEMMKRLDPTVNDAMLYACQKHITSISSNNIEKFQIVLCQWIVKPVMSPLGLLYLDKLSFLNILIICQCYLWQRQFYTLAALLTSSRFEEPGAVVYTTETRLRIPNNLVDKLVDIYKIYHPMEYKEVDRSLIRKLNIGCKAVRALAKEISGKKYQLNSPEELLINIQGVGTGARITAPGDLAEQLANLAILIAEEENARYESNQSLIHGNGNI